MFEFFEDMGELAGVQLHGMKQLLVHDLRALMKLRGVSQAELARRMNTSRMVVARLLDEANTGATLATIAEAATALRGRPVLRIDAMPDRETAPAVAPVEPVAPRGKVKKSIPARPAVAAKRPASRKRRAA